MFQQAGALNGKGRPGATIGCCANGVGAFGGGIGSFPFRGAIGANAFIINSGGAIYYGPRVAFASGVDVGELVGGYFLKVHVLDLEVWVNGEVGINR